MATLKQDLRGLFVTAVYFFEWCNGTTELNHERCYYFDFPLTARTCTADGLGLRLGNDTLPELLQPQQQKCHVARKGTWTKPSRRPLVINSEKGERGGKRKEEGL